MPTSQATKKKRSNEPTLTIQRVPDVDDQLRDICRDVSQRAFELFEQRDLGDGHDLADWLAAEAELVQRAGAIIDDQEDSVGVHINLANLEVHEVSLFLTNYQIVLRGEVRGKGDTKWLLVQVDLPAGANPDRAKAEFESDGLVVVICKE